MTKQGWDKLVIANGQEFLQSWSWGEFQKSLGKRVERVKASSFLAQVIFNPLPAGLNYGYVPRGPIVTDSFLEEDFWRQLGGEAKTIFLEVEPSAPLNISLGNLGKGRQPLSTSVLDMSKDIEAILSNFHRSLRYHIRLSQKRGVIVKKEEGWDNFFKLSQVTARRHNLRIWPKDYYKKLWDVLGSAGEVEIWSAYKNEKLLSSNLYILFGGRATYLFGASSYEDRSLMAPHFLHWYVIQEFKKRGFAEYDFWGIDEEKWPGVTVFKKRFGGYKKDYPGSYVRVERRWWYGLYKLSQKIK